LPLSLLFKMSEVKIMVEKDYEETNSSRSGIRNKKLSRDDKQAQEEAKLKENLESIKHRIMVMSGKGGVGKSTVTVNLAYMLAKKGYKVGILDADIHGPDIPKMLGVDKRAVKGTPEGIAPIEALPNLKVISLAFFLPDVDSPVIWRGPLKHSAIKQFLADVYWEELDYLFIDLPPGTGDEPLSVAHLIQNVDGSIIVTTPQDVALLDSRKAVKFSEALNVPVIGIVENMSGFKCPKCGEVINLFSIGGGEKAAKELKVDFLGRIPIEPDIVKKADKGEPIVKELESEAAKAFDNIADICIKKLEKNKKEKMI